MNGQILTGTRNRTPVTMTVKAVPFIRLEYILPRIPTENAPMKDTKSDRFGMKWFAILFVVYDTHEIRIITSMSHVHIGCRFMRDERSEKIGTIMN